MKKEILLLHNASIGIHNEILSSINATLLQGDRVGIIGPNGSGKTTLLQTIVGIREVYSGTLLLKGSCEYVSQINPYQERKDFTIIEYCSEYKIAFNDLALYITEKFGFSCKSNSQFSALSGGQQLLVRLAGAFIQESDLILLDEPTNHLDLDTRKILIKIINEFKGSVICVSHDTWFLGKITNRLWIIENSTIRSYTGSYSEYKKELEANDEARLRKLEVIHKEQRKLVTSRDQEQVRKARSQKEGKSQKFDRSTDRGSIGNLKRTAEKTAARNKKMFDVKSEKIERKIQELSIKKHKLVSGSIIATPSKGSLLHISDADLIVFGKQILSHINLDIMKGDRIALFGKNGSGKSSLVKAVLSKDNFILSPKPYVNKKLRIEYLDQHYDLVDPEKTVLDNVLDFSNAQVERARQHLSHFLFDDSYAILKKAKELSGGMLARLAFVMLTITPIDLLILDEPTNNLDRETIDAISGILSEYTGGLIVISHDIGFLESLEITQTYSTNNRFKSVNMANDNLVDALGE